MNIIVASKNEHKRGAVYEACGRLGIEARVICVRVQSEVNEQPVGWEEILDGACNRVLKVRGGRDYERGCYVIGIETGILRGLITLDVSAIAILTPDGKLIVSCTPGVCFPESAVITAAERGFETTTVGSVIAETHGGDPTDPYPVVTNGKVTRQQTLVAGLEIALAQVR